MAIEQLSSNIECIQWGGLGHLTADLLSERWQEPKMARTFIRVVETDRGLQGYSDVYQVSDKLARFHGIASDVEGAALLIDWTYDETVSQGMTVQTSLMLKGEGRTLYAGIDDHPLSSLLAGKGFGPVSTTRVMRLLPEKNIRDRTLPPSYHMLDFKESRLSSLMATYFLAWPKDYYQNEDADEIAEIFLQASPNDLRLVSSKAGDVVGYVLLSRTNEHGVIDEVAVHPTHRRKGLGEVLTQWAIDSLRDRIVTLVVMDENPARYLYEKLGFVVWEERLDMLVVPR